MSLLGLDIGTTGCKAMVFSRDGEILGRAYREYSIATPHTGWAEQDGEEVFRFACECIAEAAYSAHSDPIEALALSCQGEAVAPIDHAGRPMRPFILGMDTRTVKENIELEERFGAERLFQITGMPMHTINTLPKLLWLQKNEPDIWRNAARFCLYEDFIINRLCGRPMISACLASRTQLFDLRAGRWSETILDACGIDPHRISPVANEKEFLTTLPIWQKLGLKGAVKVFAGGHDQACAALGAGVVNPGQAMVSTGTAEVVEVVTATANLDDSLRRGGISVYRHVVPGRYVAMTLNHSGGLSLRWFRDVLGTSEVETAKKMNRDAYDLLLENAPQGPSELFVLPHFSGSGTPTLDVHSRAAFLGLTFRTRKADIAKALLEGLTFELEQNLALLRDAGIEIRELRAVGGGAKSDLWLQLKADICRVDVQRLKVTDAACLGAALAAGNGCGIYKAVEDGIRLHVALDRRFEPDSVRMQQYRQRMQLYRQIYPLLKNFFHQLT
ncbi:MAG: FGGY family carbohydrate kinase [candidate division KSB1 bacterium]|nr:FGGY family carbohydrate kinase [candidate division KSB1 bacterium]